jgi:hypothetical protein
MSYIDSFNAEDILVIKKPPISAPTIVSRKESNGSTFLEDRFVCFAYRYEYQNGEFSATSQFSPPAFLGGLYTFDSSSFLNEGMLNEINAVQITFDPGGPLVVGIELLYKDMNDPTIKVIERLNKIEQGIPNSPNLFTFDFNDQKIFTVLPESEILRLYDNVPLKAQAQTLMGNRLIYGNYYEGYNLKDRQNRAVNFTYNVSLTSEEFLQNAVNDTTGDGAYTFGQSANITNSVFTIDLQGKALLKGSIISWQIDIMHLSFYTAAGVAPTSLTSGASIDFNYTLLKDYNTVYDLATDTHFINAVGTSSNIQSVSNSCNGSTFTDAFNCAIPSTLGSFTKTDSGITGAGQGFNVFAFPNETTIGLQLLAMKWVNGANITYEYYQTINITVFYTNTNNNYSLHSNRDYEIGIIYMDDFNRSSTALVSPFNTTHTTCGDSRFINKITVNIPGGQGAFPQQVAPFWATRYKFCIKSSKSTYETIYVSQFVQEDNEPAVYFLLQGENANKVEEGDRLIVKRDSSGALPQCAVAVVLEKTAQLKGFISFTNPLDPSTTLEAPSGVYMKMIPTNFAVNTLANNLITYGNAPATGTGLRSSPIIYYPVTVVNPAGSGATANIDYTLPVGSIVQIKITSNRPGRPKRGSLVGGNCENLLWTYDQEFITDVPYDNFKAFFDGEGLGTLTTGVIQKNSSFIAGRAFQNESFDDGQNIQYNSALSSSSSDPDSTSMIGGNTIFSMQFFKNTTTGKTFLGITGGERCSGEDPSRLDVDIIVTRASASIVFETQPQEALPDVWFENNESFSIDSLGQHSGNVQNQLINFNNAGVAAQDAIIETAFSNCITFGNGIESYKIRDSINGKPLEFGNRVSTTSSQIYKEAHRFADLTYSGVFNDESNVNKLNEFNLGLANFNPLEDSFGPVRKLYARRTDVLTLQEDKISYVPVGKDLLTDASGGGTLTSVPQVLGTQIARDEEYGISNNPESFAVWGFDKFFVDAKRAAVIKLRGGSSGQEELTVISQAGMRSWFRDFFINSLTTQKLGGYDPYMNEFVLAGNLQNTFDFTSCIACGVAENLVITPGQRNMYCVDVGQDIGQVTVSYIIPGASSNDIITEVNTPSGAGLQEMETEAGVSPIVTEKTNTGVGYTITAYYNNVKYTSGLVFVSGSFTFNKNITDVTETTIEASTSSGVSDTVEVTVSCPTQNVINVYNISITNNSDALKTIHNEYRWTDNITASPVQSNLVSFANGINPVISQYEVVSGSLGSNVVPNEGAVVSVISNRFSSDTFYFNTVSNKFRYLRSSTVYSNSSTDIDALISASAEASPVVSENNGDLNLATFTMPSGASTDNNLYLIWDYRVSSVLTLCQNTTDVGELAQYNACCSCSSTPLPVECNSVLAYTGEQSYPDTQVVNIGTGTGTVTIDFEVFSIPDRLIVEFDGAVVIDTGYVGDRDFISGQGIGGGPSLGSTLTGSNPDTGAPWVEPISGQAYEPNGTAPLPTLANGGYTATGWRPSEAIKTYSFNKSTATSTVTVKVYAPLANTKYNVTVKCIP